ncbi:MAG: hypothetical protein EHM61_13740 [Acidobacteria bacterium]|nr:MAG: hypothetical protein EHM61_13740 [Acidobacteriota bacterium]
MGPRWRKAFIWAGTLASLGSLHAQSPPSDSYQPVFLESASGLKPGQTVLWLGGEFEEDSGDFPTLKNIIHVRRGIANRLLVSVNAELVRFNKGTYTAWGGSNPSFGLQYRLPLPSQSAWALQLKGEILPSWGGMASARTGFAPGVDLTRRFRNVGLHLNGTVTAGSRDRKTVGVSEVDRWRVSAGYDWALKDGAWVVMMAWIKAQPMCLKPVESTIEIGALRRLSSSWSLGGGAATSLTERGQDYLLRFGVTYRTE